MRRLPLFVHHAQENLSSTSPIYNIVATYQAAPPTTKKALAAAAAAPGASRAPATGLRVMRALEERAAQAKKETEAERKRAAEQAASGAAKADAEHLVYLQGVVSAYERRLADLKKKAAAAKANVSALTGEVDRAKKAKAKSADELKGTSNPGRLYELCIQLQEGAQKGCVINRNGVERANRSVVADQSPPLPSFHPRVKTVYCNCLLFLANHASCTLFGPCAPANDEVVEKQEHLNDARAKEMELEEEVGEVENRIKKVSGAIGVVGGAGAGAGSGSPAPGPAAKKAKKEAK